MVGVFYFPTDAPALIQWDVVRQCYSGVPTLWALNKLVRHVPFKFHLRYCAHGALQIALNLLYILQNFNKKN